MSIRALVVSVALLVVSDAAHSQPKPTPPAVVVPLPGVPPVVPTLPAAPVGPRLDFSPPAPPATPALTMQPPPPPLPPPSVEDMLNELERIQSQKAALEKKEQELKAALRKKLEEQSERLKKLGVAPQAAKEAEPDRVGRIIIEGNTKTPDQKILDKLEFRPGQILQYPALETARAKLEKAGFKSVTVEVVPNELDATFKDIRVRVEEPKPKPAPEPVPTVRG